jgi:hypothetical protein
VERLNAELDCEVILKKLRVLEQGMSLILSPD